MNYMKLHESTSSCIVHVRNNKSPSSTEKHISHQHRHLLFFTHTHERTRACVHIIMHVRTFTYAAYVRSNIAVHTKNKLLEKRSGILLRQQL